MILKFTIFCKDVLLRFPISLLLRPITRFFIFVHYFNQLIVWIYRNKKHIAYNDFYRPIRNNHLSRYTFYEYILSTKKLKDAHINYLEFGVLGGNSLKWWIDNNTNKNSHFWGFDTFDGLPEKWGFFAKGEMSSSVPQVDDKRVTFIKGLFQDTFVPFIKSNHSHLTSTQTNIIHLDADLYSATAFVLSQVYPILKKGDIIIFDEFTVALHEFKAYTEFTKNFYIDLKPFAANNNFLNTAFIVQ